MRILSSTSQEAGDDIIAHFEVDKDVIDLRLLPEAIAFADLTIVDMEDGSAAQRITHAALDGSIEIRGTAAAELSAANFAMPDGTTTSIRFGCTTIGHSTDPFVGSDRDSLMLDNADGNRTMAMGGNDRVFGGEGDDTVEGGGGSDDLYGEEGDDSARPAGSGHDRLFGGEGDDTLDRRQPGDDLLIGAEGDDVLKGGAGADVFAFGAGCGLDTVTDFTHGEDRIDLSGLEGIAGFGDLQIETYATTTAIDLSNYGCGLIRLENTVADDLDASDFVFYEPPAGVAPIDGM